MTVFQCRALLSEPGQSQRTPAVPTVISGQVPTEQSADSGDRCHRTVSESADTTVTELVSAQRTLEPSEKRPRLRTPAPPNSVQVSGQSQRLHPGADHHTSVTPIIGAWRGPHRGPGLSATGPPRQCLSRAPAASVPAHDTTPPQTPPAAPPASQSERQTSDGHVRPDSGTCPSDPCAPGTPSRSECRWIS